MPVQPRAQPQRTGPAQPNRLQRACAAPRRHQLCRALPACRDGIEAQGKLAPPARREARIKCQRCRDRAGFAADNVGEHRQLERIADLAIVGRDHAQVRQSTRQDCIEQY